MMAISITWLILHSTTLIGLLVWVQVLPESTHLDHWSSHWFNLNNPDVFLPTVGSILLLGPFSILALWGLKKQVLALEKENQKLLWAADRVWVGALLTRPSWNWTGTAIISPSTNRPPFAY